MIPIRVAAKEVGVHPNTLRRWELEGKLTAQRTRAGQRRYDVETIKALAAKEPAANAAAAPAAAVVAAPEQPVISGAIYCRVSSSKQRGDLLRQQTFMQHQFPAFEVYSDVASGTHYNRPGIQRLLERIMCGSIKQVAIASKDRVGRFGFDLFAQICKLSGVELIIIESDDNTSQEELADDIISVVTSFAVKAHGIRRYGVDQGIDLYDEAAAEVSASNL